MPIFPVTLKLYHVEAPLKTFLSSGKCARKAETTSSLTDKVQRWSAVLVAQLILTPQLPH